MILAIRIAFAIVFASGCATAHAQADYPNKPIRMVVPLAAASAVDNAARIVAQRMTESMGQPVVIENMPGASGLIGTGMDTPYETAADVIAAAKAQPGKLDYGSGGNGSPQHVGMALFASTAGISLAHVPYKGATQAAVGVAGGEVPIGMQGLGTAASLVRSGKLRLLGVSTPARVAAFPDVPTISESGLPGFEFRSWFAVVAPAGTPKAIVAKLNAEIRKAIAAPDVREKLVAQGFTVVGSSPEELGAATKDQLTRYGAIMKQVGIKAE